MKESMHRMAMLAPSPARICLAVWLSAMALAIGAQQVSAASVTYIVGTCVSGTQFSTIQKALDATPAPDTVKVCPGQYAEQITISHPVTLEGIAEGNGAQARIVAAGGMTINTTLSGGFPAVAQIYVNNVSGGDVNLTNLEVNGSGNGEGGTGNYFIGVLYQGSSGKMNQVITSNQDGTDVTGLGMWIEGGSSSSSVTVENCSVHDFTYGGIHAAGVTTPPNLTVTMKNNVVSALSEGTVGIFLDEGTDP